MGPAARCTLHSSVLRNNGNAGVIARMGASVELSQNTIRDNRTGFGGGGCAVLGDADSRPNVRFGAGNTYVDNARGDVVWEG